ncbi:hypothetical protein, partial [Streptomyces sp. NPDC001770]
MVEEAVVDPHRVGGAQHSVEEGERDLFELGLRRARRSRDSYRFGEGAFVDFAVGGEGEFVEGGEVGGDEVFGE